MKTLNKIFTIIILVLSVTDIKAQDPQFSQLYTNPIFLGPSFAGATGGSRFILNMRDQWPAVKEEYISYSFSFDQSFVKAKSAIGIVLFNDIAGVGDLNTFKYSMLYSYSLDINREFNFRPGIQLGVVNRTLNYKKLLLGDQLGIDEDKPLTVDTEIDQTKNRLGITYLDFAASALLSHDRFWIGMTADHLTKPNESLIGKTARIPMKYNFYGGVKFRVKYNPRRSKTEDFFLTYQYKHQEKNNQALLGAYWFYRSVMTGIWYRGLPVVKSFDRNRINDAFVFMAGYRYQNLAFAYSYDFTISKLVANSGGAHEVTLSWTHIPSHTKKKWNKVSCPML